jgi:glycosyltransferase involved in cell wall biosynthesis
MRVHLVDPSAYTRPYDHALCAALARGGASVELITSSFAYGEAPAPDSYAVREVFYRHALGAAGSRIRTASKLAEHVPDMLRYRRIARDADVVHFQWLPIQWLDLRLLPDRPVVLTAHDLLPREFRPVPVRAQRQLYGALDAIVVHSNYGRQRWVDGLGIDPAKVHVVPHGAFEHLTRLPDERPLPDELANVEGPVVLFFGLLRPYKGLATLLDAWRDVGEGELWIVGRPRMALEPLRRKAPAGVRFVPRFVTESELPAYFRRADVVVLPYTRAERCDFSGVLATALAFARPIVLSDIGGFTEAVDIGAALSVPPDEPAALHRALQRLIADPSERVRLANGARTAAAGPYSWHEAASRTLALYRRLRA